MHSRRATISSHCPSRPEETQRDSATRTEFDFMGLAWFPRLKSSSSSSPVQSVPSSTPITGNRVRHRIHPLEAVANRQQTLIYLFPVPVPYLRNATVGEVHLAPLSANTRTLANGGGRGTRERHFGRGTHENNVRQGRRRQWLPTHHLKAMRMNEEVPPEHKSVPPPPLGPYRR